MTSKEVKPMPEERGYQGLNIRNLRHIPVVTLVLVGINVVIFLYMEYGVAPGRGEDLLNQYATYEPAIVEGHQYYRLITHFFLHFDWNHLFNNMISLLVLGYATELVLGRIRFFSLYFLSGVGAGVVSLFYNLNVGAQVYSCGASGAIFGLSGALLVLLIRGYIARRKAGQRSGINEVVRYLIYMALSMYSGFADPSINYMAHLGGFVCGIVLCIFMTIGKKKMGVTYES